jgi:WhiB family redox-sensing transcriptional regulator
MGQINEVDMVHTAEIDPEIAHRGRRTVLQRATGPEDAARLLAMLGLAETQQPAPPLRLSPQTPPPPIAGEVLRNPEWMGRAECKGEDPELWQPTGVEDTAADAREICGWCPVREQCEAHAVKYDLAHGIWGGNRMDDADERTALRAAYGLAVPQGGERRTCRACGEEFITRQRRTTCRACELGLIADEEAHHHITRMRGCGVSLRAIAADAQVPEYLIKTIARPDRRTRIQPEVSERILALTGVGSAVPV